MGLAVGRDVKLSLMFPWPRACGNGERHSVRLDVRVPWAPLRAFALALCFVSGCLTLAGCADVAGEAAPNVDSHPQFARRGDASIAGATVAFVSIEGAPTELSARFSENLAQAAAARQIAVAPTATAHYLVRGYLSALPARNGATIDFVWDVFTPDKRRAQRLSDSIAVRGSGDDPWAMVSEEALDNVAARCADDLAAYLSNTPEAAPAAALSYAQAQ